MRASYSAFALPLSSDASARWRSRKVRTMAAASAARASPRLACRLSSSVASARACAGSRPPGRSPACSADSATSTPQIFAQSVISSVIREIPAPAARSGPSSEKISGRPFSTVALIDDAIALMANAFTVTPVGVACDFDTMSWATSSGAPSHMAST